ncbi:hypothetical protein C8R45DRAFT_1098838 [Mycena sanguinolenta]|nr:hypothetical protein C8R45DRAFT_1098838 [Mycena sanguinolenta]
MRRYCAIGVFSVTVTMTVDSPRLIRCSRDMAVRRATEPTSANTARLGPADEDEDGRRSGGGGWTRTVPFLASNLSPSSIPSRSTVRHTGLQHGRCTGVASGPPLSTQ